MATNGDTTGQGGTHAVPFLYYNAKFGSSGRGLRESLDRFSGLSPAKPGRKGQPFEGWFRRGGICFSVRFNGLSRPQKTR